MARTYDPLKCIPSANVVRKRLADTEELVRKLRVLLATAEQLEQVCKTADSGQANEVSRGT